MEPIIFATKKDRITWLKSKLANDRVWAIRAMEVIAENQTDSEFNNYQTTDLNGAGFSAYDAEILTSFTKQVQRWRSNPVFMTPLTGPQMKILFKRIPRYAEQLLRSSDKLQRLLLIKKAEA